MELHAPAHRLLVLCNFCGEGQKRLLFVRKKFLFRTLAETLNTKPRLCASHVTENHFVYSLMKQVQLCLPLQNETLQRFQKCDFDSMSSICHAFDNCLYSRHFVMLFFCCCKNSTFFSQKVNLSLFLPSVCYFAVLSSALT